MPLIVPKEVPTNSPDRLLSWVGYIRPRRVGEVYDHLWLDKQGSESADMLARNRRAVLKGGDTEPYLESVARLVQYTNETSIKSDEGDLVKRAANLIAAEQVRRSELTRSRAHRVVTILSNIGYSVQDSKFHEVILDTLNGEYHYLEYQAGHLSDEGPMAQLSREAHRLASESDVSIPEVLPVAAVKVVERQLEREFN